MVKGTFEVCHLFLNCFSVVCISKFSYANLSFTSIWCMHLLNASGTSDSFLWSIQSFCHLCIFINQEMKKLLIDMIIFLNYCCEKYIIILHPQIPLEPK